MGPKKNKSNRNKDEDDEQFSKKQKELQEKLKKVINKKNKQNEVDEYEEQVQIIHGKKQKFDYDFSQEKVLIEHQKKQEQHLKQKQKKDKEAKQLTPQQQAILDQKLEKQKRQKQIKQKKKEEKIAEKFKKIEQEKQKQEQQKQEEKKQEQQVKEKVKESKGSGRGLPIFLGIFILFLFALQYQKEIYVRLSKFKLEGEQNFYQTLEIDSGATDKELKEKYKRLVLKYHPDKNPNCQNCEQKFNNIIVAWEVLGSPQKRKNYDSNSGFVTRIKSQSITLTPEIYDQIQNSRSLWIIQVYDSTEKYCHYFAQFWQDVVNDYSHYIKFARVDTWTQSDMLSYLPYSFQIFPSLYFVHKNQIGLCDFDFQKPDWSIRRCIEAQYKENIVKNINNLSQLSIQQKPAIILGQKIKLGNKFKIIHKKYQSDFKFYTIKNSLLNQQITVLTEKNQRISFDISQKNPQFYIKYEKFLQSLIVEHISICQLIERCQDSQCLVLIDKEINLSNFTLPSQKIDQMKPVYFIQDRTFYSAINKFKNKTDQTFQKFEIGAYMNSHFDLGYLEEIDYLKAEQGQNFNELRCVVKDRSILGRLRSLIQLIWPDQEQL